MPLPTCAMRLAISLLALLLVAAALTPFTMPILLRPTMLIGPGLRSGVWRRLC